MASLSQPVITEQPETTYLDESITFALTYTANTPSSRLDVVDHHQYHD
jgi:hypothetical protein